MFGKEEGKHKSIKIQATTQEKIINDDKSSPTTVPSIVIRDRDQRCDRNLAFFARLRLTARSRKASIMISDLPLSPTYEISRSRIFLSRCRSRSRSGAISRRRDHNQRRDLAVRRFSSLARARSLSLSLSLSLSFSGNALKGK